MISVGTRNVSLPRNFHFGLRASKALSAFFFVFRPIATSVVSSTNPKVSTRTVSYTHLEALSGKMLQLLGLYQNHTIQMEMTPAGDLLNHVIDMEKEQAEKKKVQLKMEYEAFSMKMDPALMESLLVNLIDNALKATDAGGSILVKAYETSGKKIFEVSDTGIGIPEEELGKITDAFYMVDKSRSLSLIHIFPCPEEISRKRSSREKSTKIRNS